MEEIDKLLGISKEKSTDFQYMRHVLGRCLGLPELSNHFPPDYEKRIKFLSKSFQYIPMKQEWLQKLTKNNEVSGVLRSKANALFGKGNLQEALKLHNLAIMFAEPTGEELGLAFANRSAVMLEQKDPKGGLKDIQLALKHNYPERLMPKLEKRRDKCGKMQEDIERSFAMEDVKSDIASRRKFRDEELLKLKSPNPRIPSAEDFVDIEYTKEAGRQLVVNKDVPAGTVVMVERPFTSVSTGLLKFDEGQHCDTCWKFVKNGIPCKRCVFVMYCNEECRNNAECGHHKFECSCLSSLYLECIGVNTHVALRVVCKVGPKELYRLFTTRDPSYFGLKKPFGTEPGCKYESDSYLPIHHLLNHSNELEEQIRHGNGLKALQLVSVLEARTNFFGLSPKEKRHDFKNFVAAILLQSMETVLLNGIGEEEIELLQGFTLADVYLRKEVQDTMKEKLRSNSFFANRSTGIYCVGSLMNHSCDPSVMRVFVGSHGTMAVVTTRWLKKGDLLTTGYCDGFQMSSMSERKLKLKHVYNFDCQCVACKNDWPTDDVLLTNFRDPEFTCPSCSKKFSHEEKGCGEFLKCCLSDSRTTCKLCGKSYKRGTLDQGFQKAMTRFEQVDYYNFTNRPLEALKAFREVAEYLQDTIRPPHFIAGNIVLTSRQALALIVHFAE